MDTLVLGDTAEELRIIAEDAPLDSYDRMVLKSAADEIEALKSGPKTVCFAIPPWWRVTYNFRGYNGR